jgi:hypothetical protein
MGKEALEEDVDVESLIGEGDDEGRIRCPKCAWRPRSWDRWSCLCGTEWNTFDTRGVCPGCAHAWKQTQCLKCGFFSPHEDWYVVPKGTIE